MSGSKESTKARSSIKLGKFSNSNVYKSEGKSASRYGGNAKSGGFRERDLISGFHNYSLMSPSRGSAAHNFSGKNILQESSKTLAKSLVFDRKIQDEKALKVGSQVNETQMLVDYYNNKHFIDRVEEGNAKRQTIRHKSVTEIDLPYLKANSKVFNKDENPKYGRDVSRLETLNLTMNSESVTNQASPTTRKLNSKLRSKLASMNTGEFYTPGSRIKFYKPEAASAAGKPSGSVQKTLAMSGSADPISFRRSLDYDHPFKSQRNESAIKIDKGEDRSQLEKSICSLTTHKRRTLKIMENINKNIAKLHKHSKVNWSIKDVPLNLLTKPASTIKSKESMLTYNQKSQSLGKDFEPKYDDFITGAGYLKQPSELQK